MALVGNAAALGAAGSLLVSLGCATTAPALGAGDAQLPAGEGLVVGRFGVPPHAEVGALQRELQVINVRTGQRWQIPFAESLTRDDRRTAPFFVRLPAGRYRVGAWLIAFMREEWGAEKTDLEFDVVGGRIACVGSLYSIRVGGTQFSPAHGFYYPVLVLPHDSCEDLGEMTRARAPALAAPWEKRLATSARCPRCRAELEPASSRVLDPRPDAEDLPPLVAEGLRVAGARDLPFSWPADLADDRRTIVLRVCVSVKGDVSSVSVLVSAHPDLDSQLVAHARTWRFRPFERDGTVRGFCYRPRFELRRP